MSFIERRPARYSLGVLGLIIALAACGDRDQEAATGDPAKPLTVASEGAVSETATADQAAPAKRVQPTPGGDGAPLPIEEMGIVQTLPPKYPDTWFLVHDAAFFHMLDGKVYVIDAAADTIPEQVKGTFNLSFIGNVTQAPKRGEIYVVETFYSRGVRGERTDTVTIYDKTTLAPLGEVVWPTPKRFMGLPERYALITVDSERLLLAYNFNPAASVTVIDLYSREIVNDVSIPGCALMYPTGVRGFTSICSNGGLLSTQLDEGGQVVSQERVDPFFDTETSPVFERGIIIDGTLYLPSFDGMVYPIDVGGETASVGEPWSLVSDAERQQNWRPGGTEITDADSRGRFYVLMHPDGGDGSHNGGGSEIWAFDPATKSRVARIPLRTWGLTLALSRGPKPLLMVTTGDMALEVYNPDSGEFLREINGIGQETPLTLHGAL